MRWTQCVSPQRRFRQAAAMADWLAALLAQTGPAVLVTVAQAEGSVPREAGARMLVTATEQFDTIGGGHLELKACQLARDMLLLAADAPGSIKRLQRFPLGPSLGQCCGGAVSLAFERIDASDHPVYRALRRRLQHGERSWRLVCLDDGSPAAVSGPDGRFVAGTAAWANDFATELPARCETVDDAHGRRWLLDPVMPPPSCLYLFGAGHVGAAIVRVLAQLPCRVIWIDERDGLFPDVLPPNVSAEASDTPEALIDVAAPGASFLVMTHSHALDQRLAEHILRRGEFAWFGLIGSRTKRIQFERRLGSRGISKAMMARMTCPVGVPGIRGKTPAVIAVSVAAQLLQVWEQGNDAAAAAGAGAVCRMSA